MLTEQLRSQISERKQELLGFLRSSNKAVPFIPPPISRRKISGPAALSFAQERLWFLEQLEPSSNGYNLCRAWRLAGCLNVAALEASLNQILRRHDVLRSAIQFADGRPLQSVQPPVKFKLEIVDLQQKPEADREAEIRRRIQETAEHPFDFAAGMFLRAEVLRVTNDEHILVLATHHIVSDAWSMGILSRELWSLYKTYTAGKSCELEELPIQYADFAVWQREWLQGKVLDSQISYWKKQLADLPINNLPSDRSRAPRQTFRGARLSVALPVSLSAAINELSNECSVTPFMTLLAVFQVLLYRYTGEEDIVVGSPIANRSIAELEPLVGFFVNTLVLRTDLSGNPTFKELLFRVREVCLAAYEHQDFPFEKLVQELQPERDQSRNPLFQVMFGLQNATGGILPVEGLRIEPIEFETGRSLFDLSLFLRERNGKFIGQFEYSTDLFERDTIERMAGYYRRLLEGVVADPDQPIATLPILSEAERHKILIEWNDTAADYPKDKCIHELFEAQVERTPDAVAVEFENQQITYRELNRRANQLAHYLSSLNIEPEKRVGICTDRSIELVLGLLGILKAGGAYVPFDPAYPKARLEFMLQDSRCSVLLTQEKWLGDLAFTDSHSQLKIIALDRDADAIRKEDRENPRGYLNSNNLAYVIYTSGSTGTPKGVAVEHRNTVALLNWAKEVFTASELAGVLASTSICFDLSVFELFAPLSWGGRVVLVDNALNLYETPEANRVTLINTVPAVMTALLRVCCLPDSVRVVNLAGEPLRAELVEELYKTANVEKVYDLYGPSETTTYSTFKLRTTDSPATIGRPISNTQVYILDSSLQPVPIGMRGEIFIGGSGVARGYLGRTELTEEKFIKNPFSDDLNSRLYRTGDLARYLPDGQIQFHGRADNQVKIRGYRVELGQIESVLSQHPGVKESVVVVREDIKEFVLELPESNLERRSRRVESSDFEKRLVAYIVARQQLAPTTSELRSFLAQQLPGYMIPAAFVRLDYVPLNDNGKLDRSKLPAPDESNRYLNELVIAPRTETEELIANVWKDVLKLDPINVHDNFFELGGHSLLAIQIVARLSEALNQDVLLKTLFDAPTIRGLAEELENTLRGSDTQRLPPILPAPRDGPLPLSMNQEHLWHLDKMIPGTYFFNMPYVYRLSGDLNVSALESALADIIGRHEALRTVFGSVDGRPVQIIKESAQLELPTVDLVDQMGGQPEEKAAAYMLEERQRSFNLSTGPLFRSKLLRLTYRDWLLLVTIHHIIGDYWSMQTFRRELIALYDAFSKGSPPALSKPVIQFADYAIWEKHLVENGRLDSQLVYWKKRLAPPLSCGSGSEDGKRKKILNLGTMQAPLDIGEKPFASIKTVARRNNCTPFMVVMTVLSIAIHGWSSEEDIRIGTLVANRAQGKTGNVIGPFLNTVILRIEVSSKMSVRELLSQVRTVTLAAHVNENLPFEHLVRVLEQEQKAQRDSLCPILMSYQMSHCERLERSGITFASVGTQQIEAVDRASPTAFDLIFKLRESSTNLTGTVNYVDDRFATGEIGSILDCFDSAVKSIVVDVESLMSRIVEDVLRRVS